MGAIKPKKHLGQNFLKDRAVLASFIKACDLKPEDTVIEVGAGTGTITVELAKRVKKVIAFELDSSLASTLANRLNHLNLQNVEVRNADILDALPEANSQWPAATKIVGAIPYQITSPLLHELILNSTRRVAFTGVVFIMQLEVAEKITARPPKASYLSNFVQAFGQAEIVGPPIPPSAFWPEPKVRSAILKITPRPADSSTPPIPKPRRGITSEVSADLTSEVGESARLFPAFDFSRFLHHGFRNPRKMLNKAFPKEVLAKAGIDATLRPQNLSLEDWIRLFRYTRSR